MTVTSIHISQSRVVWFLALSCIFGGRGVAQTLLSGLNISLPFAVGWGLFVVLTATAAWCLYQSKRAGWYLSLIVALSWLAGLFMISWNLFTIVMTVGMVSVLIWL